MWDTKTLGLRQVSWEMGEKRKREKRERGERKKKERERAKTQQAGLYVW